MPPAPTGGRPDVDLLDPTFHAGDPHPAYTWMRHHEPIFRERNGIWCITRMDHVRHVERLSHTFVSSRGYRSVWFPHETSMIARDDPAHQEQRALVSDLFTRRSVSELEPMIRRLVDEALATTNGVDRFDVVDTLAARLPAEVTCHLLGWPLGQWRDVRSWSERLMRVDMLARDPRQMSDATRAVHEMTAATVPAVESRRGCPAHDVLGRWANATLHGRPMSLDEIVSELGLVVPGGAETTRTTLSRSLILLAGRPDLWEWMADDPGRIPGAVEELLRWVTPLNNMFRTVAHDTEIDGVRLAAGDRLALVYPSANRDEAWFDHGDEVDLTRDPCPHISFGFGTHLCLGANLARLQLRVVFEELTRRYTNLRAAAEPVAEANVFVNAVERFEIAVDRR